MKTARILLFILFALPLTPRNANAATDSRAKSVSTSREDLAAEVERRRVTRNGGFYVPKPGDGDYPRALKIVNMPIWRIAPLYAEFSGKRVRVAQGVGSLLIDLEGDDLGVGKAIELLEKALLDVGVKVAPIGDEAVEFVLLVNRKLDGVNRAHF